MTGTAGKKLRHILLEMKIARAEKSGDLLARRGGGRTDARRTSPGRGGGDAALRSLGADFQANLFAPAHCRSAKI